MGAEVEEDDFLFRYPEGQDNSVRVRETDGVFIAVFPVEAMQSEPGIVRITFKTVQNVIEKPRTIRMSAYELSRRAKKCIGPCQRVFGHVLILNRPILFFSCDGFHQLPGTPALYPSGLQIHP